MNRRNFIIVVMLPNLYNWFADLDNRPELFSSSESYSLSRLNLRFSPPKYFARSISRSSPYSATMIAGNGVCSFKLLFNSSDPSSVYSRH